MSRPDGIANFDLDDLLDKVLGREEKKPDLAVSCPHCGGLLENRSIAKPFDFQPPIGPTMGGTFSFLACTGRCKTMFWTEPDPSSDKE